MFTVFEFSRLQIYFHMQEIPAASFPAQIGDDQFKTDLSGLRTLVPTFY